MNQYAMIAKRGDSTSLSSLSNDREGFASKKPCEKNATHSIFQLKSSELLIHLLHSRVTHRESCEKTNEAEKTPKNSQHESSKAAAIEAHESFMTKRAFCSIFPDDKRAVAGDSNIFCSTRASERSFGANLPSFSEVKHGRMDEQCDETNESDNIQSHLFTNEVQSCRSVLQRNISGESDGTEHFSEEEDLPRFILGSDTLDFILYGSQKELCIESPAESQNDPRECDVTTEFNEFTELVPFGNDASEMEVSEFSPVASTSGTGNSGEVNVVSHEKCTKNDGNDSSSSEDVDDAMVLVPTDPLEWTSTHIKSWLDWCTRKFSLHPKPDPEKFPGTGGEICDLSRTDFEVKAGSTRSGTILAKYIAHLRHSVTGRSSSPLNVECKEFEDDTDEDDQDPYQLLNAATSRLVAQGSGQIQLWQFLLELLNDSSNAACITWEGTNGEFKLTDPDELSRALRYYYDKNIMSKVHGKRYAYKFDFHGLMAACQAQAQGQGDVMSTYHKYQPHQSELGAALYPTSHSNNPRLPSILPGTPQHAQSGLFPPPSYWPYSPGTFDPRAPPFN
ncbi:hypothetical protein JTB14_016102 [Gonioctena quinquepunctata]|nr:hypothetical protein JTB14_016102 [Gonioctena quinquepunctata]